MSKVIEFNVPVQSNKGNIRIEKRKGFVAWLKIGNIREKFVLQFGSDDRPEYLTHFRTGFTVGKLNPIKIGRVMAWGTNAPPMSDREAGQILLDAAVATLGQEAVLDKMSKPETMN